MTDDKCHPTHKLDRDARTRRVLLLVAYACLTLNFVAILVLFALWRATEEEQHRSEGSEQADQAIKEIESTVQNLDLGSD